VRTLKVLLVEDDEDHVFVVRRALRDLPDAAVTLEVAGDGEQAMERLAGAASTRTASPSWSCSTSRCRGSTAWRCCAASAPT
jgi:CheY-like chemotaxis protein